MFGVCRLLRVTAHRAVSHTVRHSTRVLRGVTSERPARSRGVYSIAKLYPVPPSQPASNAATAVAASATATATATAASNPSSASPTSNGAVAGSSSAAITPLHPLYPMLHPALTRQPFGVGLDPPPPLVPTYSWKRRLASTIYEGLVISGTLAASIAVSTATYPILIQSVGLNPIDALMAISTSVPLLAAAFYALTPNSCPDPRYPLSASPRFMNTYRTLADRWAEANRNRIEQFFASRSRPSAAPATASASPSASASAVANSSVVRAAIARAEQAVRPRARINFWFLFAGVLVGTFVLQNAVMFLKERAGIRPKRENVESEEPILTGQMLNGSVWPVFVISVLGPAAEELFFRGFVFRRMLSCGGTLPAYAVNSAVFGMMHASDESDKIVETGTVGAVLALAYRWSGFRLWVPILLHGVSNSIVAGTMMSLSPLLTHETRNKALRHLFRVRRSIVTFQSDVCLWLNSIGVPLLPSHILVPNTTDASGEWAEVIDSIFDRYADMTDLPLQSSASATANASARDDSAYHVLSVNQLTRLLVQHHPTTRLLLACVRPNDSNDSNAAANATHAHTTGTPPPALSSLLERELSAYRANVPSFKLLEATAKSTPLPPTADCYGASWLAHDIAHALFDIEIDERRSAHASALHRDDQSRLQQLKALRAKKAAAAAAAAATAAPAEESIAVSSLRPAEASDRFVRRAEFHRLFLHAVLDNPGEIFRMLRSLGYDRALKRVPPPVPTQPATASAPTDIVSAPFGSPAISSK